MSALNKKSQQRLADIRCKSGEHNLTKPELVVDTPEKRVQRKWCKNRNCRRMYERVRLPSTPFRWHQWGDWEFIGFAKRW